jgi:hypothetical protein
MIIRAITALASTLLVSCQHQSRATANPPPSPPQTFTPRLLSVTKIHDAAPHNAFTDLARFNDHYYCAFREGSGHVPGTDGVIRVLRSPDANAWTSVAQIKMDGVDLRDAKLSITPDNRLMLLMGGSVYKPDPNQPNRKTRTDLRTRVSFSADGENFSPPQDILDHEQWLWRLTWHKPTATGYGVAYSTSPGQRESHITLHRTTDGLLYQLITKLDVPGQPNEATIRFLPDETMLILVRREAPAPDRRAWLGTARPPYTDFTWQDAGRPAQGPDFIVLPNQQILYAGRDFPDNRAAKTVLGEIRLPDRAQLLHPVITLPSGGDTSYPGLALAPDGNLLMSYYSSHEGKTAVYLARIALDPRPDR